ncbi:FUSC family protein [Microbacterium halophytorum]|uniref:FUSC family protein n=1 Tax=Microbacterium halophytorum TaxID=2067568 RepID=UPI000CFC9036|nr:FUSC family protein [Microbacterium halophytorum]
MPRTATPPASGVGRTRRAVAEQLSRFVASDPGFSRLRSASFAVLAVGLALLAEWLFFRGFSPMAVPADSPGAGAANRAALVMAMMAGAMVAMVSSFVGPMFDSLGRAIGALLVVPTAMCAGAALGLLLAPWHVAALVVMVAILGAAGFLRRAGAWGFGIGQGLFMGNFFGVFLSRLTDISGIGWIAAELAIGAAVAIAVHVLVTHPSRRGVVARLRRSFRGRADGVAAATIDVLDHPASARARRRAHTQLVRMNETALMIDAQLAESTRLPVGTTAAELHAQVFAAEVSLANAARFARTVAPMGLPDDAGALARRAMAAIGGRDADGVSAAAEDLRGWLADPGNRAGIDETTAVVLHRFASSVSDYADVASGRGLLAPSAGDDGARSGSEGADAAPDPGASAGSRGTGSAAAFEPAVELFGGWLPGSSSVSATASEEKLRQRSVRLHPSTRLGIQMTVAAAASVTIGSLVAPDKFYWAVIATFVTFMGANNAAEQVRKGALRVIGTVVGVVIGSALALAIGDHPGAAIVAILASLFIGLYLMRVSYAVFTCALTVVIALLYMQLAQFSEDLLALRLLETVIGAAVAVLTVVLVLPLRTGRVVRVATREFLDALGELIGPAVLRLRATGYDEQLLSATRKLDAAFQTLEASTAPSRALIRVPGSLGGENQHWWAAANAAHSHARNLVADTRRVPRISGEADEALADAAQVMLSSINELARALGEHPTSRAYTRTASRFERVAASLGDGDRVTLRQLALRDLQLVDGALASLALAAGVEVRSLSGGERA